jgi:hypothetical protein
MYIDTEKLIAEIERLKDKYPSWQLKLAMDDLYNFITSLQQEQPEVDLEKEILNWIGDEDSCKNGKWTWCECNKMLRHFYELGVNARNER